MRRIAAKIVPRLLNRFINQLALRQVLYCKKFPLNSVYSIGRKYVCLEFFILPVFICNN